MYFMMALGVTLLAVVGYQSLLRPRLRASRLAPLRNRCGRVVGLLPTERGWPVQDELRKAAQDCTSLQTLATRVEERARSLPLPEPEKTSNDATAQEVMSGLAEAFNSPQLALGVAGGEQLVANILDISNVETVQHLGAAASALHLGDLLDAQDPAGVALNAGWMAAESVYSQVQEGVALKDAVVALPHQVAEGMHGAHEQLAVAFSPEDAAGFHFPLVTMIVSTARETALLLDDKTSIDRAVAHVVLDTGATAAGGFGGAKLGAAIGTLIAPGIGTAIGGALGAIGGALGGRFAAQKAKAIPLENAVEAHRSAFDGMQHATGQAARQAVDSVRDASHDAKAHYLSELGSISQIDQAMQDCLPLQEAASNTLDALARWYRETSTTVNRAVADARAAVPPTNIFHRLLGLDVTLEAQDSIFEAQQSAKALLAPLEQRTGN